MTLLIDATIRCSVLLVVGLAASALAGRRSAALRHCVLAGTILAATAVVPLGYVLPAWDLPPGAWILDGTQPAPAPGGPENTEVTTAFEPLEIALVPLVPAMWLAGSAAAVAMLLGGLARVRALAARARPVRDERWLRMAAEAAAQCGLQRPPVLLAAEGDASLLATWGLLHPRIMLPTDAFGWSDERVRVVLLHELAHVRRGDCAVQLCAELLGALYWFNPLMWIACVQLRREGERACDDAVLRMGVSPPVYAGHLVDLARACRGPRPAVLAAMPMARASALQERVTAMLNPALRREGLSRRAVAATALWLLAITLPAAAFRAPQDSPTPLAGAVYDPSGAALPEVELTLEDAQHARMQVITDASGRFEFPPVPPGDYVLEASLPGFRRLHYELTLSRARDWNQVITLQVGEVRETISVRASRTEPSPAPRLDTGAPVKVGGNIRPPRKIKDVKPQYPASMKEAGMEGVVPLEAVIGRDGSVTSVRVLSAKIHPDLAMAAVDAVRQWKFEPTLLNGAPVDVQMTVTVNFRLSD